MSMRFVFFGTPEPAVETLEILRSKGLTPAFVVTNPDRPQGRRMTLTLSPVKLWAMAHNVPFLQPESPSDSDFLNKLKAASFDLFVVVAYGAILPKVLLDIPRCGVLNIHYSLLPQYRGATPIESQILNGEKEIGVTIMLMDEKMDHGPIVAQRVLQIRNPNIEIRNNLEIRDSKSEIQAELVWPPRASELRRAMSALAGEMLTEVIPRWVAGEIQATPQDHTKATYTKKFTKADGEVDLNGDPYMNLLKIRAFESLIGTYFFVPASYSPFPKGSGESASRGILKSSLRASSPRALAASEDLGTSFYKGGIEEKKIRVLIKSAEYKDGKLNILRVIPEGRREMSYDEFLRGLK